MRFVQILPACLTVGLFAGFLSLGGAAQAQSDPTLAQILAGDGAYLTATGGSPQNTFLVATDTFSFTDASALKIASYAAGAPQTTFGYYDAADPAVLHPLWNDSTPNGTTATFSPTSTYGFYINTTHKHGGLWSTQTGLNSDGGQHIEVYQRTNGDYYLAFDDANFNISDKDYNDLVVKVQAVPEASSVVGFGLGAAVLLLLVKPSLRRRRAALSSQ